MSACPPGPKGRPTSSPTAPERSGGANEPLLLDGGGPRPARGDSDPRPRGSATPYLAAAIRATRGLRTGVRMRADASAARWSGVAATASVSEPRARWMSNVHMYMYAHDAGTRSKWRPILIHRQLDDGATGGRFRSTPTRIRTQLQATRSTGIPMGTAQAVVASPAGVS